MDRLRRAGHGGAVRRRQCGAAAHVRPGGSHAATSNLDFLKLDYRPNERNSFSASMNYLKWNSINGIQTGITLHQRRCRRNQRRRHGTRPHRQAFLDLGSHQFRGERVPLRLV